jgi:hypothetical protein
MTFLEAYKYVIGTMFYWLDKLSMGEDAKSKEYWQSGKYGLSK